MNKNRTIHGIDLTAPGGLEALFAYRRAQFGDAQMNANAGGETPPAGETPPPAGGETPPAAPPAGEAPPATPPAGSEPPKGTEWDGKVESLPAPVQKLINDLRKADGDERIAKKTLDAIQKAINPEAKEGEKPDPEALTKALSGKDDTIRELSVKLALKDALEANGANKLTATVLAGEGKLKDLDPTAKDFETKLAEVVKDAVKRHPELKLVRAAGTSGADFTGGSGEGAKKPTTLEESIANKMARK